MSVGLKKGLVAAVALVGLLTNVPSLAVGTAGLVDWIRLYLFGVAYFQYPYAITAFVCYALAFTGMATAWLAIRKQGWYGILSLVSLLLGIGSAIVLPNIEAQATMGVETQELLMHADYGIQEWDEKHGRYPATEQELIDALHPSPLNERAIFLRKGCPIPFGLRMETNSTGPTTLPIPLDPGVFSYFVGPSEKEYWLTVTTLKTPVSEIIVFNHLPRHKEALVINRKHR